MALTALGGSVELAGPGGTRRVIADDFFVGYFETAWSRRAAHRGARAARPGAGWATRSSSGGPTTGPSSGPQPWPAGSRGQHGAVPVRARAAEEALAGGASPAEAAGLAADGTEPGEDIHADGPSAAPGAVLTRRALEHRAD